MKLVCRFSFTTLVIIPTYFTINPVDTFMWKTKF